MVSQLSAVTDSGVVRPSPACARALELALSALSEAGHTIVPFNPPDTKNALRLASQLLLADGGRTTMSHYKLGQNVELGLKSMMLAMSLPRWVKWIWSKFIRLWGDNVWADLVEDWNEKTGYEQQKLVVQRYSFVWISISSVGRHTVLRSYSHGSIINLISC
jgi:hypothetical protein